MTQKRERPRDRAGWDQRYVDGDLPWDIGEPDHHLRQMIDAYGVKPGKALEIGCGTGTNLVWLAQRGFEMTGLDLSPTAIARAQAKVAAAGLDSRLLACDFLVDQVPGGPFEFVYDRGCMHVFDDAEERARFAARVGELLVPDGMWHSLIGSTDGPPRDMGPPRRSAMEIAAAVEPHFEIVELRTTLFDQGHHRDARAWVLMARRRS